MATAEDFARGLEQAGPNLETLSKRFNETDIGLRSFGDKTAALTKTFDLLQDAVKKLRDASVEASKSLYGGKTTASGIIMPPGVDDRPKPVGILGTIGRYAPSEIGGPATQLSAFGKALEAEKPRILHSLGETTLAAKVAGPMLSGVAAAAAPLATVINVSVVAFKALNAVQEISYTSQKDTVNKLAQSTMGFSRDTLLAAQKQSFSVGMVGIKQEQFSRALELSSTQLPEFQKALLSGGQDLVLGVDKIARGAGLSYDAALGIAKDHAQKFGMNLDETAEVVWELKAAAHNTASSLASIIRNTDSVESSYRPYIKSHADIIKILAPYAKALDEGTMSMGAFTKVAFNYTSASTENILGMVQFAKMAPKEVEKMAPEFKTIFGKINSAFSAGKIDEAVGLYKAGGAEFSTSMVKLAVKVTENLGGPLVKTGDAVADTWAEANRAGRFLKQFGIDTNTVFEILQGSARGAAAAQDVLATTTLEQKRLAEEFTEVSRQMTSVSQKKAAIEGMIVTKLYGVLEILGVVGGKTKEERFARTRVSEQQQTLSEAFYIEGTRTKEKREEIRKGIVESLTAKHGKDYVDGVDIGLMVQAEIDKRGKELRRGIVEGLKKEKEDREASYLGEQ